MTTSTSRSARMPAMSAVEWGDFFTTSARYLPMLSCVMPRSTITPVLGTSANLMVLLGSAKMASERSFPTLFSSISKAATTSMSSILYPPIVLCMTPETSASPGISTYLWIPWTSDEAQLPTPMIATLIFPTDSAPFPFTRIGFHVSAGPDAF